MYKFQCEMITRFLAVLANTDVPESVCVEVEIPLHISVEGHNPECCYHVDIS